eukprot:2570610-Amphidinium_carterae.1
MGFVYPLQGVWTRFSGLRWHAVLPSRGERYSISLFSPSHMDKLGQEHWRLLAELGFQTKYLRSLVLDVKREGGAPESERELAHASGAGASRPSPPLADGEPIRASGAGASQSSTSPACKPSASNSRAKPKVFQHSHAPVSQSSRDTHATGPKEDCCVVLIRRLRCQGGSNFCHFLAEVRKLLRFQCPGTLQCRPALSLASEHFMPWGCPFPDVWSSLPVPPSSRRRRQRWKREHDLRELTNVTVMFLNWMHVNSRFDWDLVTRSAQPCSEKQLQVIQPLMHELKAWCRSDVRLPSDGGLPAMLAALRERTQKIDGCQPYSMMGVSDEVSLACAAGTKQLTPMNMALPMVSGQTPLVAPTVPPEIQAILQQEGAFQRSVQPERISRTFTSVSSWLDVAKEMMARRLVTLLPPSMTTHFRGKRVTAGLFGVEKKGTSRARVIVDRRAQNDLEHNMREVVLSLALKGEILPERAQHLLRLMTLPYAAQFSKLLMSRTSTLALSTEDAADYYYHLELALAAIRTNCIGPLLDADELRSGC